MADVFVLLPPPAHGLASSVLSAGATPILDATTTAPETVPEGCWVRVRAGQTAPGAGPVILAEAGGPVKGRETWLEATAADPIPEGFAGVVLKGIEAYGRVGNASVLSLLARHSSPTQVIVAGDHTPREATALAGHGVRGVLVASTLLGLPELKLPTALARRLDLPSDDATHVVGGHRVGNPATAPVLRSLVRGDDAIDLSAGIYTTGDPMKHLWLVGRGLSRARALAEAHGDLAGLVGAYVMAAKGGANAGASAPKAGPSHKEAPAIAIIGMGCRFPDANSLDEFWDNLRTGRNSIREVPAERWDPALFWDADREAPDKTYAKIGGFLHGFKFNSRRFRIPPKVAKQIDPVQQITLASVADALEDAGLKVDKRSDGAEFDRARCAVILGNSLGGEVKDDYAIRLSWPEQAQKIRPALLESMTPDAADAAIRVMEAAYKQGLPEVDEDSMPGELSNVIAGRIANAFDLGGANYTVDAACASSMAALQQAMKSLADGEFDLAVTGGADRSMNVSTYVKFCKIGALSPDHSSPFDASANGFVMGEGCGILVLKRYEDAVADGNRIYAIIRGVGASSDGKGKGITAPNPIGQLRALRRAYEAAGINPADVDMVECHGTSTVVGDKVETEALTEVIGKGARKGREPIRIGSVKSQIGHLKSAAAAAAIIKTALSLHKGIIPPSINVKNPRTDLPLGDVPLKIATVAEPWPQTPDGIRRAAVSAFGFGGTNFHVVLESFAGQTAGSHTFAQPPAPQPTASFGSGGAMPPQPPMGGGSTGGLPPMPPTPYEPPEHPLPEGLWATSARTEDELITNLKALREGRDVPWNASSPLRIAAAAGDDKERNSQIDRALKVLEKGSNPDMLRARAIHYETAPVDGKVAFVFTGQGSQYLDMGLDLAATYPIVQATFDEADRILEPTLGKPITAYIKLLEGEDREAKDLQLRQTEYSQPATLTVDVAILRLLASFGVFPDLVAGHSLGEYGAAVAAGIMTFEQALYAVSARGREMANIKLEDPGKMAGIAASAEAVEEILAEVDGYVVAANKNCPTQTVIAGASDAVEQAMERFRARGMTVYPLPVSHAFHSRIVAPASEPLRGVLTKLGLKGPQRPITTNVTAEYYDDDATRTIDILARQIASPVEWTSQIERMYADGARVFVECGPKRALTGFTVSILKRRPHRALYTNHPKRGGMWSFRDCLAGLLVNGMPVTAAPGAGIPDLFATAAARRATTEAIEARLALAPETEALPDVKDGILAIVARQTGYDPAELDLAFELEANLGIDTVKQAEIFSVVRETYGIPADPGFSFADHKTLSSVIDWASRRIGATQPTMQRARPSASAPPARHPAPGTRHPSQVTAPTAFDQQAITTFLEMAARAGMSGLDAESFAASLLPAVQGLLSAAYHAASGNTQPQWLQTTATRAPEPTVVCTGASVGLPGGEEVFGPDNLARILSGENRISHIGEAAKKFLDMNLVRLVKDPNTGKGEFMAVSEEEQVIRLAGVKGHFDVTEYGVDKGFARALDVCTALAMAAGVEALRDAGIPLVRRYKTSASGKQVPGPWLLPEPMRDNTGIIFASAFPGYSQMAGKLQNHGDDGEGRFDRRFLFQVLSMGHSQFAQFIGARGPNTAINAACASTTQSIAIAHDWIRTGRCERVVIISADDVTGEELLPWIGSGFLAAGAATPKDKVEEAALPFDARRHGMILGMGAAALVLETDEAAARRGVVPIARLLGTTIVNSAFHGTRLDRDHIANAVTQLVADAASREGTTPTAMAQSAMFMSHETYTPARGGSAAAEIDSLRQAFGPAANQISIANTKGFTGHAMGAGIEDAVAIKAMQYGIVPPIANFEEPDPSLGDLRIRKGERRQLDYGLRLAAGFGSQLALVLWRRVANGDDRVSDPARRLQWLQQATGMAHVEEYIDKRTLRVKAAEADKLMAIVPEVSPATNVVLPSDAVGVASSRPEAPVPQPGNEAHGAELVAAPKAPALSEPGDAGRPLPASVAGRSPQGSPPGSAAVLSDLIAMIAEKTGYEPDELEADFELEADLGIDTVKQAEIFSELRDRYGVERDDDFQFADYPTIESLAGYMAGRMDGGAAPVPVPAPELVRQDTAPTPSAAAVQPELAGGTPAPPSTPATQPTTSGDPATVLSDLVAMIAEKTGYEPDELEPDFELEADLGIDTVKQAEIFSELRDRYGVERDDDFQFADYPTIESLAGYMASRMSADGPLPAGAAGVGESPSDSEGTYGVAPAQERGQGVTAGVEGRSPQVSQPGPASVLSDLVAMIAEKTGYEPEELEPDFELEADLGIDTVKQAEIFSELRDRYGVERDDDFQFADYPTIESLAGYMASRMSADGPPDAALESPAVQLPPLEDDTLPPELTEGEIMPPAERNTDLRGEFTLPVMPHAEPLFDHDSVDDISSSDTSAPLPPLEPESVDDEPSFEFGPGPDEGEVDEPDEEEEAIFADLDEEDSIAAPPVDDEGFNDAISDFFDDDGDGSEFFSETLDKEVEEVGDLPSAGLVDSPTLLPPTQPVSIDEPDPAFAPDADSDEVVQWTGEVLKPTTPPMALDGVDDPPSNIDTVLHLKGNSAPPLGTGIVAPDDDTAGPPSYRIGPFSTPDLPVGPVDAEQATILRAERASLVPATAIWGRHGQPSNQGGLRSIRRLRTIVPADEFLDDDDDDVSTRDLRNYLPPDSMPAPIPAPKPRGDIKTTPLPESFVLRRPVHAPRALETPVSVKGKRVRVLGRGALASAIRRLLKKRGAIDEAPYEGIVDLQTSALESFRSARDLVETPPQRWLTLTRIGTDPSAEGAYKDGARAGFTKALGREWTQTTARVLDVDPGVARDKVAEMVSDELFTDGAVEVFIDNDARRIVGYDTVQAPPASTLFGTPVVLITGGARGISSKVALELAKRGPVKLALVGRGPIGDHELDVASEKKRIKAELKAGGGRVRPVDVQNQLKPLIKAEEVRVNVLEMESHGAEVKYYRADLADPESVRTLIEQVRGDFGTIDVVIHGAGVEESRLIADKDEDAWHRVFDGKAIGGHALASALPPEVMFVSMGSVAGRFGNAGQVDYAAANDALARLCVAHGNALHICWTAWDDVGMAVRGGMKSLLEGRGVDLLPADAGAGLLVDMMAAGMTGEIVVAGALGDFEPGPEHPLIDRVEIDGDRLTAWRELSMESDPWIEDHAIDKPVLPGVIGIELMVAATRMLRPQSSAAGMMDVTFKQPIKLHKGKPTDVIVEAEALDEFSVKCSVASQRTLRTGRVQRTEHFEATVLLDVAPEPDALPSAFFPPEEVPAYEIYNRFFHGPRFQVLANALGVAADGIVVEGFTDDNGIAPGLLSGPLSLEAGFQAAGLHRMLTQDAMALPASIRELIWERNPVPGERLDITCRLNDGLYDIDVDGETGMVLRARGFEMIELGPLSEVQRFDDPGYERPNVFSDSEEPPAAEPTEPEATPEPVEATVQLAETPAEPALPVPVEAEPDDDPDDPAEAMAEIELSEEIDVSTLDGRPVAETIAPTEGVHTGIMLGRAGVEDAPDDWLTVSELDEVTNRGNDKRIADRIAGRIAAKRAIVQLTGVTPHEIRIESAPSGLPMATVIGHPMVRVSISHREGHAIAAAVPFGHVGIDLEEVRSRGEAFANDWFTDEERAFIGEEPQLQTIAWCAKESVLKLMGVGMARSPREVEITDVEGNVVSIKLHGDVADDADLLGIQDISLRWQLESSGEIVVSARGLS